MDNVSAPHNSQQEGDVEYFPELYNPSALLCKQLELVYIDAAELTRFKLSAKDKIFSDILGYIKEFRQARTNPDSPPSYAFTNRLYYSSEDGRVRLLPCYSSAWNILGMYSVVASVYNGLVYTGVSRLAIGFGFESLLILLDLFNCIFSTPEQLTNYFLDRRSLDMEVHRIANTLSQNISKMVHVSIDYESLYAIVRQLEKNRSVNDIGGLLGGVLNYIVVSPALRTVHNFTNQVAIEQRKHLANTFMIQIYRRYFMSSFLIGNVYVLGFDNGVSVMLAKDRNSINSVDVQNLRWVMWLTRKLPDEVFLDQNMVIGLYICDLAGNFFKLNDKFRSYLLDPEKEDQRQLDINDLVPVLPTNVLLSFADPETPPVMRELSLKRSESSIRSRYESQSITLTLNTRSGVIKQSEFGYPAFSLVHHFRLSTSIQSRVQTFRRFLTDYHEEAAGQLLEFSFDESLSVLPEIELFENIINVSLYELEKVYEELAKLDSRDKNVE
ncbi:unnamed protein product [Sphagnum balticum]